MDSLHHGSQADAIEALNSTDDLFNVDNTYFEGMDNQIYQPEPQLNTANITEDTGAPFLNLHLYIGGFVSSKTYDKSDDYDEI